MVHTRPSRPHPPALIPIAHIRSHRGHLGNELVDQANDVVGWDTRYMEPLANICQSHSLDWLWLALDALHSPSSWPSFQGSGFVDYDRHSDECTFSPWECRAFFGQSGNDDSSPVIAGIQAPLPSMCSRYRIRPLPHVLAVQPRTAHISPRRMSVTVPIRISRATSELNSAFLGYTPSPELAIWMSALHQQTSWF